MYGQYFILLYLMQSLLEIRQLLVSIDSVSPVLKGIRIHQLKAVLRYLLVHLVHLLIWLEYEARRAEPIGIGLNGWFIPHFSLT